MCSATTLLLPPASPIVDVTRVLILSSNTGGGHSSAALALEDSLLRLGRLLRTPISVTTRRVLEEATDFSRRLADLYNYLLRHHQHYMKYYYWAINHLKPNEWPVVLGLAARYGRQLLDEHAPNVIVSVHPMVQHLFAYVLRHLRLLDRIPLVTVVTDPCYGFWKGWACPDVAQYYVASEGAQQQLQEYGIPAQRITVEGLPVHSRFQPVACPAQQARLRYQLGLDPALFTVFVNAGWIGGGNIPEIFKAFVAANPSNMQLIFVAGQNDNLRHWAAQHSQQLSQPALILGKTDQMADLMGASDVLISKLGGLTTFEALASGLPILADGLTPPMPQEAQTATYLTETGCGLLLTSPTQAVEQTVSLQQHPLQLQAMRQAARASGHSGAAQRIARRILNQDP